MNEKASLTIWPFMTTEEKTPFSPKEIRSTESLQVHHCVEPFVIFSA